MAVAPGSIGRTLLNELTLRMDRIGSLADFLPLAARHIRQELACGEVELCLRRGERQYRLSDRARQRRRAIAVAPWHEPRRGAPVMRHTDGWQVRLRSGMQSAGWCRVRQVPVEAGMRTAAAWRELGAWLELAVMLFWSRLTLRERVKELACLNGLARLARPGQPLPELLTAALPVIAAAWLHAADVVVRLELDGIIYGEAAAAPAAALTADLRFGRQVRGTLTVGYRRPHIELDEGPFLAEERQLLETTARQLCLLIEQREAEAEQAAVQEQLRHADRLATIGQLAAGVAHELNEPLGAVLGFAQLVQKSGPLPGQAAHDLERIVGAAMHARQIVKNLLMFARQMPAQRTALDLNALLTGELDFLEQLAARQAVTVVRDLAPALPVLAADAVQMRQVLTNLAVNALQAMPDGGTLTLATRRIAETIVLTVSDTGSGIAPEILSRIFDPFFTTKEAGRGTGLGLPVVHGIVSEHGGSIAVSSRPRRGTRFTLTFPLAPAGAS